jgi:hypothetical protein
MLLVALLENTNSKVKKEFYDLAMKLGPDNRALVFLALASFPDLPQYLWENILDESAETRNYGQGEIILLLYANT